MVSSSSSSSSSRVTPIVPEASTDLSSYKLIGSCYPMELDYEGEIVICFCKLKSPRVCAWTDSNPGKRFYGCQRYLHSPYSFHCWHDEKFSTRGVEIINDLKRRERYLYQQARQGRKESLKVENKLKLENEILRRELEFRKINSNRRRKATNFHCISLGVAVICLVLGVALVIVI